jgi:hypothetical protein
MKEQNPPSNVAARTTGSRSASRQCRTANNLDIRTPASRNSNPVKAQQSRQAHGKGKPLPNHDPVFLELFSAALSGAVRGFKRNPARSFVSEEAMILQEAELAWRFAKRARELIDLEEAKACRLPPIVAPAELCQEFNSRLIQSKPQSEDQAP